MNNVTITGYLKSVREAGQGNYKVILGNISQRDAFGKCIFTSQIVALDDNAKAQLLAVSIPEGGQSETVKVTGSLKTYFDNRSGKLENRQQIVAHAIEVVG